MESPDSPIQVFTRHLNMECFESAIPANFVSYAPTFFSVSVQKSLIQFYNVQTHTPQYTPKSINNFTNDDAGVNFYTGLETLTTFYFVLRTLGPAAHCLNYIYRRVSNIGVPDRFFLVFCKLRRHITNFERSRLFGVSEKKYLICIIYFYMDLI